MKAFLLFLMCTVSLLPAAEAVLTPESAGELALKNNKLLQASEWKLKEQEYGLKDAYAAFLPRLVGSASYTRLDKVPNPFASTGDVAPTGDPFVDGLMTAMSAMFANVKFGSLNMYNTGLQVQQPLFAGFQIFNAYRLQKASLSSQKAGFEATQKQIRYGGIALFWALHSTNEYVKLSGDARSQLEVLKNNQEKMLQQNLIAEYDFLQIKSKYMQVAAAELKAAHAYTSMEKQVVNFLGLEPGTKLVLQIPEQATSLPSPAGKDSYLKDIITLRPDIASQQKTVDMLNMLYNINRGAYLPTIAAVGSFNYNNPNREYKEEFGTSWMVTLALNWNLFDWGMAWRKAQKTKCQISALKAVVANAENEMTRQALDAWEGVFSGFQEYEAALQGVEAAEKSFQATEAKYKQNMVTTFELLTSQSAMTQAKASALASRMQYELALENLKIGGMGTASSSSAAAAGGAPSGTGGGMMGP